MAHTSRHDLGWWSDPDYDETGKPLRVVQEDEDAAYERQREMLEQEKGRVYGKAAHDDGAAGGPIPAKSEAVVPDIKLPA